tara:strand:- start:1936 stop:2472 length:537 start_codon:yes stop_codon:yes gene_type:complete
MDLEAESTVTVDTAATKDIAESCNKLLETQNEVQKVEDKLKKLKETERELSEMTIPSAMQAAGLSMLKLENGVTVDIRPFYAAKIPASKQEEAFEWLRDNGAGDLIKNIVSLNFGKSEDQEASNLVEDLKTRGYAVDQKMKVEPMTLKAYVKERIQNGQKIDMELFGVYIANKTKLTK